MPYGPGSRLWKVAAARLEALGRGAFGTFEEKLRQPEKNQLEILDD